MKSGSNAVAEEVERRLSLRERLRATFEARPHVWISIAELAKVAGVGAWRSRLVELRTKDKLEIQWNRKNGAASAYCFKPGGSLGRDASIPAPDHFDGRQRRMF